jgi:hypothetical protein
MSEPIWEVPPLSSNLADEPPAMLAKASKAPVFDMLEKFRREA